MKYKDNALEVPEGTGDTGRPFLWPPIWLDLSSVDSLR